MDSLRVYLSPNYFIKPNYYTMFWDNIQIHGVKITGKCICNSKYWIYSFLLMPQSNTVPRFLASPPRQKKIIHFSKEANFENLFPPVESGDGKETAELKKWPKLTYEGIGHTTFALFTVLVSVSLYHNLDSSMLKCEGSLNMSSQNIYLYFFFQF